LKLILLPFALALTLGVSGAFQRWEKISENGFAVDMPGKPVRKSNDIPTDAGTATGWMLTVDNGTEAFIVAWNDFPASVSIMNAEPKVLLTAASKGALEEINGTTSSERYFTLGPHPAYEVFGEGSKDGRDLEFRSRMYWAKPRLIQTLQISEKGRGSRVNGMTFLDSFKFTSSEPGQPHGENDALIKLGSKFPGKFVADDLVRVFQ